jgi:glycosyltransferase involved in cell wall biosynthesis
VGTVEPRKNYARLVELVDSAADNALPVVLVGRPGWGDTVAAVEDIAARHPGRFIWLRDLPDEGLLWLYRRAACFLSLSRAEGFNMPLVESAMCARPVICSNIPIHRFVAPPWARFASDDATTAELWDALRAAADAPPSSQAVTEYRQRYSWERVASRLLEFLGV